MHIGESQAKHIVNRALRDWEGTTTELYLGLKSVFKNRKGISTVKKRDSLIRKKFGNLAPNIYLKEVSMPISGDLLFLGYDNDQNLKPINLSKAERKRRMLALQKENRNKMENAKNSVFTFVAKADDRIGDNSIYILMNRTERILRDNPGDDILGLDSVASITRHCLERVVQRLNYTDIKDALDEIVDSLPLMMMSVEELLKRPSSKYGSEGFKRHIPTKNGALLINHELVKTGTAPTILETSLVTWIHKDQFKGGQDVSKSDFLFAILINEHISNSDIEKSIDEYKNIIKRMGATEVADSIKVKSFGETYPVDKLINTLERGKYLDFMIEFD